MTALTAAQLFGRYANDQDMHHNCEVGLKATGASSAIAPGRAVSLTQATGVWALATAAARRMGIVPNKAPINADADDTLQVETRPGVGIYGEAGGAIKPGDQVIPTTGGKWIAFTTPDTTGTVNQSTVNAAIAAGDVEVWIYEGHNGEAVGLDNTPTDAASGEAIRLRKQ